jgi:hypothetical protein
MAGAIRYALGKSCDNQGSNEGLRKRGGLRGWRGQWSAGRPSSKYLGILGAKILYSRGHPLCFKQLRTSVCQESDTISKGGTDTYRDSDDVARTLWSCALQTPETTGSATFRISSQTSGFVRLGQRIVGPVRCLQVVLGKPRKEISSSQRAQVRPPISGLTGLDSEYSEKYALGSGPSFSFIVAQAFYALQPCSNWTLPPPHP